MSHPAWYTYSMMIETDMTDKLFEVRIATGYGVQCIKAFDLAHAKRIAKRKWGATRVQPVEGRFERFKEFNR